MHRMPPPNLGTHRHAPCAIVRVSTYQPFTYSIHVTGSCNIQELVSPAPCYQCIPQTAAAISSPPPATCTKEDAIFSELGRRGLGVPGWGTSHTSRSTCGGQRSRAYNAVGRFHPHGYSLPTRGPGGEGSLGTEL
jgi:hypothetical protein